VSQNPNAIIPQSLHFSFLLGDCSPLAASVRQLLGSSRQL
jgi:hypothetical protein